MYAIIHTKSWKICIIKTQQILLIARKLVKAFSLTNYFEGQE